MRTLSYFEYEHWTELDTLEQSARTGTLHQLIRQLKDAATMLGPDLRAEVLERLHMALRVDLAFLVAHPEEAFSCLYNRLAWAHARAGIYYDLPAGNTALSAAVEVEGASDWLLREVLHAWRAAVEARGTLWLRALRPPEIGLQLPLLEEYRTDAPQHFRRLLWLDRGTRLALVYGPVERLEDDPPFALEKWHCIAWDRATGRRVFDDVVRLPGRDVSPDGRYRLAHREWGQADLFERDAQDPHSLACSAERQISTVAFSVNGMFLAAAGYDADNFGFVSVYDLRRRAPIMSLEVTTELVEVAISPTGTQVAASGRETYVWEVATQREVYVLPVADATLAFTEDGRHLVTAQRGVVRVWDMNWTATVLRHYRGGISSAAFSPDGERLVTGSWLCAARTGEVIAHLDISSEYIEDGPAKNASVMGNRHVAGDPKATLWCRDASQGCSYYTWEATAQALSEVNRALGDARRGPRWTLERREGCLALVEAGANTPITWFPADDEMIAHPDASIWAGGPVHVRLEGAAAQVQPPRGSGPTRLR